MVADISNSERALLGLLAAGNIATSTNILPLFDVHHRQPLSTRIALATEFLAFLLMLGLFQAGRLGLGVAGEVFMGKWTVNNLGHWWIYHRTVRPVRLAYGPALVWGMVRPLSVAGALS